MGRIEVTLGERYERLVVIKEVEHSNNGKRQFLCECDCGNETIVRLDHLRGGKIRSCGCLHKGNLRHGYSRYGYKLYKTWREMKYRCSNPNIKNYGNRGIKVCPEWENDFMTFREWALNNGYSENLTIDRINVNGNYEPSNCRWVNKKVQANNRRTNILITYQGETHTMSEWADITGIKYWNIKQRYETGLPLEQVFFNGDLRSV